MKPHWFHILLALTDEDRHGSSIARAVRTESRGEVVLWPVTLYGSLAELEEAGLIESLRDRGAHPVGESERRKYYRITRSGRRALEAEGRRLAALAASVQRRIRTREAT